MESRCYHGYCSYSGPQAYYRRGWTKLKVDNSKGILDINKSLAINPSLFQVWLYLKDIITFIHAWDELLCIM